MRVVIADDAVLVREGLARLLAESGFEVVGEAGDAQALLSLVRAKRPDVAVVDIRMPPTHTDEGLAAAAEIRDRHPETGVLVLSQYLEPQYAMRLVEQAPAGVGYLLKERVGRVEELTNALRRVSAGECVVDRMVVQELLEHTRRQEPLAELSPRERQILELMAEGRSNQGIREELWLSPKTVETHIRTLFNKLGLRDVPESNRRVLAVLAYLSSSAEHGSTDDEDHVADNVAEPERMLVTILFTDLVDSTQRAASIGDSAWASLVAAHNATVRRELARYAGEEIDTAGDGFLVLFDTPASAVRCALAVRDQLSALGLYARVGIHTAEVERRFGDKPRGIAIHVGARIMALAGRGEVLVSATTRELVAGSGLEFEDRGVHELKGVPGEWRLYAVRA
jgi:DNA-binding NarL/FixJ family response regulator